MQERLGNRERWYRSGGGTRIGAFVARLARVAPRLFAFSVGLVLLLGALWAVAVRGFWNARAEVPAAVHVALIGTFLYVVAVSAGFESSDDRYRLPLVPIGCVYAARAFADRAAPSPRIPEAA
jgi:hypothetical protein